MQNRLRKSEVVLHHISAVVAGGIHASPLMKNRVDSRRNRIALDRTAEFIGLHEIGNPRIREVANIFPLSINYQDFADALLIERFDNVTADETGAARHNDHCLFTSCANLCRSEPRTENLILSRAAPGSRTIDRVCTPADGAHSNTPWPVPSARPSNTQCESSRAALASNPIRCSLDATSGSIAAIVSRAVQRILALASSRSLRGESGAVAPRNHSQRGGSTAPRNRTSLIARCSGGAISLLPKRSCR